MSARPASANATTGGGETKYAAGPPGDLNMNLRSECPTVFLLPVIIAITIEALGELAGWCATRSERCMSVVTPVIPPQSRPVPSFTAGAF